MRGPLLVLLICLVPCADALAAEAAATDPKPVQFVDKSYISLPKSVGIYSLEKVDYDAGEFAAGINSEYAVRGAPDSLSINLYVFPQGEANEAEITENQMAEVEKVIRMRKSYSDVVASPRTSITVEAPPPSLPGVNKRSIPIVVGNPTRIPLEEARKRAKDAPTIDQAMAAARAPTQSIGRRQMFSLKHEGKPMRSAAVQFHRQLFNIKLRISVPESAITQDEFVQLVDSAARALVPKVDIRNVGKCGEAVVFMQESGDKELDAEANARALFGGQGRLLRDNCALADAALEELPVDGYERVEIVYPPGTWE
jgi:hypothetical protein